MIRPLAPAIVLAAIGVVGPASPVVVADPVPPTYLVLPFENVAEDPNLDWLSTGLALSLGEYLRGVGAEVVDDEDRTIVLEGNGIPAGASLTLASVLQLGRKLRARSTGPRPDRTILGRFNVTDGELTLQARSIDLRREYAYPWVQHEGRLKDLLKLHARLAANLISEEDDRRLTPRTGKGVDVAFGDPPLLAFETYCRALGEADSRKRLRLLRQAIREYPDYHRAAYQAAALLIRGERWDEAADMLDKAAGDPQPYRYAFHVAKATVALNLHDPESAAVAAVHAIGETETARAYLLLGRARLALGDREAARAALGRAETLDASDPEIAELRSALNAAAPAPPKDP